MANGMAERAGTDEWSQLLAETRDALTTLRTKDLEALATHAQRMLDETFGVDLARASEPATQRAELGNMTREHRLLGDLLLATDQNLQVLRRLRNRAANEVTSPWVR